MVTKVVYKTKHNELKKIKVYLFGIRIYQKIIKSNEPTFD